MHVGSYATCFLWTMYGEWAWPSVSSTRGWRRRLHLWNEGGGADTEGAPQRLAGREGREEVEEVMMVVTIMVAVTLAAEVMAVVAVAAVGARGEGRSLIATPRGKSRMGCAR